MSKKRRRLVRKPRRKGLFAPDYPIELGASRAELAKCREMLRDFIRITDTHGEGWTVPEVLRLQEIRREAFNAVQAMCLGMDLGFTAMPYVTIPYLSGEWKNLERHP
jgi:hypothetical protein